MKQQITIRGEAVDYTIDTKNVMAALGSVYISRPPAYVDILRIIFLGLKRTFGYTLDEFVNAVNKGEIYASRKRGQYPISTMRPVIMNRVRQINKDYANNSKYGFS